MDRLKVLVVDDESRMRKLVRDFLVKKDFQILEAENGADAVDLFFSVKDIALVILDVMMPKMDGWEVCRTIREYISKPFSPKILVARVEAILRRTNNLSKEDVIKAGAIEINKAAHMVTIDGKPIDLSFKEFELLTYFVENQNIALSREKILNSVWNYDYFGDARTIDTHVKKLRSKLGDKGDYIKTIWGMGYKFEVI